MKERIISVKNYPFQTFIDVQVLQSANQHMEAKIIGIVDHEFAVNCGERGIYSKNVSVIIEDENSNVYTWLCGDVEDICISACGDVYTLTLKIVSCSKRSDVKKRTRTFQDITLTYEEVASILSDCSEEQLEILIQNEAKMKTIEDFLVQYEETDWEFLKRLASRCHSFLFPCVNQNRNGIYLGMHPCFQHEVLNTTEYTINKDIKEYYANKSEQKMDVCESDYISYLVKSDKIYNLCDCIELNGIELYVFSIESKLVGARMTHTYTLKRKKGFCTRTINNLQLTGVTLQGKVKKVQNDEVTVELDHDVIQRQYRWFPYSTIYSSPDDTGWYFMPEPEDQIRLVFPNEFENNSYVVSSVHCGERTNPDIKSIRTHDNKEIVFAPEYIRISNGNGSHIELHDDDGITIYSDKQICIESNDNIDIKGKGNLTIRGEAGVILQQKENRIDINDTIDITAGRLRLR